MTVERLADLLCRLDLEPTGEDVLDVLWLASHLGGYESAPADDSVVAAPDGQPPDYLAAAEHKPPPLRHDLAQAEDVAYALHLRQGESHDLTDGKSAVALRAPAPPALGGQLNLSRALRPLKRRVASRHHLLLDEEGTAARIADEGLWVPALTPAPTRWLEIAIVADGYESMSIWRQAIAELRALLEGLGAFRDVRFWILDHHFDNPGQVGVRKRRAGSPLRSPWELVDPAGNRVILVISDCLGPMWQSQVAQQVIAEWARRGPVAIVQPLPQRLWRYSHARPVPMRLHSFEPGVPNGRLICRAPTGSVIRPAGSSVPVPILELNAAWLSSWTRLLAATGAADVDALVIFAGEAPEPAEADNGPDDEPRTAMDRVQDFRATASPGAVRLAEFLAAAPISLPVIRLVQQVMLGYSNASQLAEVFLGGLLYRLDSWHDTDPDDVTYEFIPGVREVLIRRLRKHEALQTLQAVSEYVGARFGQARDFRALLVGGDLAGEFVVSPDSLPFAEVAARVLRLLGGHYAESAVSLSAALAQAQDQTTALLAPHPQVIGRSAGDSAELQVTEESRPSAAAQATPGGTGIATDDQFAAALARISLDDRRSRQRPLVCPYCYHAFAERDMRFRCAGRAVAGRVACPPERDQILDEKFGQSVILPPVFVADGRRDTAHCPTCHEATRAHVCPACHSLLPATFRAVQGRLIALVGPSQAGKTAYMTVLIHEMRHQAGERLNASVMGADESSWERYIDDYEWPLYERSELRLTPPASDRIRPLIFRFTIDQHARFRERSRELLLSFADSAGEDLVSAEKIELMARYLAAADAVIVLIDPLQLRAVRDQLGPATPVPRRADTSGEPAAVFDRITRLLLVGTSQDRIHKPVAIVLSKLDAIWQLLPTDDLLSMPKAVTGTFDDGESLVVHAKVQTMLDGWGASAIDQVAREHYQIFRYFGVSALGVTPTASNRVSDQGIHPYRVIEPFMWLLNHFGSIRSV